MCVIHPKVKMSADFTFQSQKNLRKKCIKFGKYLYVVNVDEIFIRIRIFAHNSHEPHIPASAWPMAIPNYNTRADPGEVRRVLPEDNRTNRRSHAFRSKTFCEMYPWWYLVASHLKNNLQEYFPRDGENWQEGSLLRGSRLHCARYDQRYFVRYDQIYLWHDHIYFIQY